MKEITGGKRLEKRIVQKVGDRDKPSISVKDYAFCVNANPMSDRQQLVLEIEEYVNEVEDTTGDEERVHRGRT